MDKSDRCRLGQGASRDKGGGIQMMVPRIDCWGRYPLVRRGVQRAWVLVLLALLGVVTACGTHGDAGALPPVARATLAAPGAHQAAGSVTLTPFYGGHVVVYYAGHEITYQHAAYGAQLRSGGCYGSVLAALTAEVPAAAGSTAPAAPAARVDPAGGVDVAQAPAASWNIVVFASATDPHAVMVACGAPLSGQQQYFDLYPPEVGSNGTARGMTLVQPQIYTRITVALAQPAGENAMWTLRRQSCTGTTVASGTFATGASSSQGLVFADPTSATWWLATSAGTTSAALCDAVHG